MIPEGEEAEALAKLPIAALDLDEENAATFALWGIGTLGELAALPEAELVARMGPQARRWRALARGAAEHAFQPIEPEFSLEEFCEFETPVEQIDSLLFVGARMIDCLVTRAAGRALALASHRRPRCARGRRNASAARYGRRWHPRTGSFCSSCCNWRLARIRRGRGGCAHAARGGGSAEQSAAGTVCAADAGALAAGCDAGAIESDGGRGARGIAGARRYASCGRISHGGLCSRQTGRGAEMEERRGWRCGACGRRAGAGSNTDHAESKLSGQRFAMERTVRDCSGIWAVEDERLLVDAE